MYLRYFYILFLTASLLTACSSEENLVENANDDVDAGWIIAKVSTSVMEGETEDLGNQGSGSVASSRALEDLNENYHPKGKYPSGLPVYLRFYKSNALSTEYIELNKAGEFRFRKDEEDPNKYWFQDENNKEVEFVSADNGDNVFFFSSVKENMIDLPMIQKEDDNYFDGNARLDYGDKLFATDGYFFKVSGGKIQLYQKVTGGSPIQVEDWEEGSTIKLQMKRMTTCVSICTLIIKEFERNSDGSFRPVPIPGFESNEEDVNVVGKATLNAFKEASIPCLVSEIFTRKKVLTNYPYRYDMVNGLICNDNYFRTNVYLCNREDPSYVDYVGRFLYGKNGGENAYITGMASDCDSYPFLPSGEIAQSELRLYMGVRKHNSTNLEQVFVPFVLPLSQSSLTLTANKHTYFYVCITLDNIKQLVEKCNYPDGPSTKTRAIQEEIVLNPEQLIVTSEPYRPTKN